jgi:DNA-binding response OmpR family regulator
VDHAFLEADTRPAVAIIDDDPVVAVYLLAVLRAEGHCASWFGDGESALRCLTGPGRRAPALVLLDLSLPGISGLDVLDALVRAGALARSRVVMMSSSITDVARAEARAGGAADFLPKPVHLDHIRPWLPADAA